MTRIEYTFPEWRGRNRDAKSFCQHEQFWFSAA
jgi:hypothetical protein